MRGGRQDRRRVRIANVSRDTSLIFLYLRKSHTFRFLPSVNYSNLLQLRELYISPLRTFAIFHIATKIHPFPSRFHSYK